MSDPNDDSTAASELQRQIAGLTEKLANSTNLSESRRVSLAQARDERDEAREDAKGLRASLARAREERIAQDANVAESVGVLGAQLLLASTEKLRLKHENVALQTVNTKLSNDARELQTLLEGSRAELNLVLNRDSVLQELRTSLAEFRATNERLINEKNNIEAELKKERREFSQRDHVRELVLSLRTLTHRAGALRSAALDRIASDPATATLLSNVDGAVQGALALLEKHS